MAKKHKTDPNRLFKALIAIVFAIIVSLFLYFAHRYYVFSRENELLRADYQEFLHSAREVLATMKNNTDGRGVLPPGVPPPSAPGLRQSGTGLPPVVAHTPSTPVSPVSLRRPDGTKKDIVIGMAQNIDPKNFAVFCGSLRRYSTADVAIFVNTPVQELLKGIADKNSITLVEYSLEQQSAEMRNYHASTLRWTFIYDFFKDESARNKYQRVWMVDVRDTFFQGDPFAMLPSDQSQFYVFKGVESKTIANCGWNGGWVKDCFGQQVLGDVGNGNIICSGVSVGTMDTTWAYLQLMNSIVTGEASKSGLYPSSKFPSCERNGVDQGVHNVLVHQNKIPNVKIWGQRDGPVANMQAELYNLEGTTVKNKRGEVVAVAHQYDRNQELQKKLFQAYVYWVDTSDPLIEWRQNSMCEKYDIVPGKDLFKGVCDFKITGGATGPSSCCDVCSTSPKCKGFVYASGSCFYKVKCPASKRTSFPLNNGYSAYVKPQFE